MTLRQQILNTNETLSDLAWAAEQRFREAEALLCAGRFAGTVYLFGLASEMWMKLACFYLRGGTPSTWVRAMLVPARTWMQANVPGIYFEQYHSLLFWSEYLIRFRTWRGSQLPADVVGQVRHHVGNRLYNDWKIDMRYRSLIVSELLGWRVYNDSLWLRVNWPSLWR